MPVFNRNQRKTAGILAAVFFFCVCNSGVLPAQDAAPRAKWTAAWISHPTAPLREPIILHFKKMFSLSTVPAKFVVDVSADNRFIFFVNGERVGDGPARGDLANWRYETFDISSHLKNGENTLSATVWNFGVYAPVAQMSNRTAFLVQGDTDAEAPVNTNDSWMVEEEQGQIAFPRVANGFYAYFAAGPGETLDAARYDWDWLPAAQSGSGHWVHAKGAIREVIYPDGSVAASRQESADAPWALVPDTLPHMKYELEDAGHVVRTDLPGSNDFPRKPASIPTHSHVHIMMDRGSLTTAYPRVMFSGGKGAHVVITYSEALYDKNQKKGNRNEVGDRQALGITDSLLPDGGAHRVFEPLWWRTWRYADLNIETSDEPLTLESFQAYFTAYPYSQLAEFNSSDPDLKKIWDIGWHTTQLVSHETYMDTPYYEQLQYVGDTRIDLLTTYAVTGDERLPRQAIRAFNSSRVPEGITQSRYPSALPQFIPPFSLLWIGTVHDYWMNRPDTAFVQEQLAGTRTVLNWYEGYLQPDGLLRRNPWWNFVDWVEGKAEFPSFDAKGESCLLTLHFIGALQEAGELENALGDKQKAAQYQQLNTKAMSGVTTGCWDNQRQLIADSPARDAFSQQANALAVLYDVIPKDKQPAVIKHILAQDFNKTNPEAPLIEASYYFKFYVVRAMDHAGMGDQYLQFLQPWRDLLPMGFSTWPESLGETRSDSHAWSAHPTYHLITIVAGIQSAEPGFKTVRVAPHLGSLTSANATYLHAQGKISTSYTIASGKLNAVVDLPPGLSGTFVWHSATQPLHPGHNEISVPVSK
jgi:alpha-L-rhamnosidase